MISTLSGITVRKLLAQATQARWVALMTALPTDPMRPPVMDFRQQVTWSSPLTTGIVWVDHDVLFPAVPSGSRVEGVAFYDAADSPHSWFHGLFDTPRTVTGVPKRGTAGTVGQVLIPKRTITFRIA